MKYVEYTNTRSMIWGGGVLLLASLLALFFVQRQFGGYDLSPLIDLTWRLKNNEFPGIDFINTMPPVILLVSKIIALFDMTWIYLTVSNIMVTIICYGFLCIYGDQFFREKPLSILAPIILCLPLIYTNHIWHSSLSQLLGIVFVFSIYANLIECRGKNLLCLIFASALFIGTKQNLMPFLVLVTVLWIILSGTNKKWTIISAVALGFFIGILLYLSVVGLSFGEMKYLYESVLGRGLPGREIFDALISVNSTKFSIIPFFVMIFVFTAAYFYNVIRYRMRTYLLLCLLVSIIPIVTDWDAKINNLPLPLFIAVLISSSSNIQPNGSQSSVSSHFALRNMIITIPIILILMISIYGGYSRERMRHVGPFFEDNSTQNITQGYFSGLKSGQQFSGLLGEIYSVKKLSPNGAFFFGPRIEFGYAVTKSASPHGMPLWWHPGTSYALSDTRKIVEAFVSNNFDYLVFYKSDRTRMPEEILNFISKRYEPMEGYEFTDIYRRRSVAR